MVVSHRWQRLPYLRQLLPSAEYWAPPKGTWKGSCNIEHSGVSPLWLTQRELKDKASSYLSWPGSLQRVGRGYSGDSIMATLFQGLLTHPLAPLQLPVLRVHLQFPPGPRWDPTKAFEPHSSGKRRTQNYSPDSGLCTRFSSAHTQRQKQP